MRGEWQSFTEEESLAGHDKVGRRSAAEGVLFLRAHWSEHRPCKRCKPVVKSVVNRAKRDRTCSANTGTVSSVDAAAAVFRLYEDPMKALL